MKAQSIWQTTRFTIDLSLPRVMGIVNVTPDSFSDGGAHFQPRTALVHCEALVKAGAHILDIGGESTRPGSVPVTADQELQRLMPVVREAVKLGVAISVDTSKAAVMREVLDAGVDIINDIWALRRAGALDAVATHGTCGACLMHMHGEPLTMQLSPMEGQVVASVHTFLLERATALQARGIKAQRIALDPGIGFGKSVAQNFSLLARQADAVPLGYPTLSGWSRKSSLGAATGLEAGDRLVPSVVAAVMAVERGARIVRVHDVAETVQALRVWNAARASVSSSDFA